KRDFERYSHPSYLRGEFRDHGWWYYYLYALAIKVPLGTWLLIILASTCGIWRRWTGGSPGRPAYDAANSPQLIASRHESDTQADGGRESASGESVTDTLASGSRSEPATTWRDEFILLAPAIVILVFVSSQTGFSEHM